MTNANASTKQSEVYAEIARRAEAIARRDRTSMGTAWEKAWTENPDLKARSRQLPPVWTEEKTPGAPPSAKEPSRESSPSRRPEAGRQPAKQELEPVPATPAKGAAYPRKGEPNTREEPMDATVLKRGDVVAAATAEARELMKGRPGLSEAAARAEVWRRRPDLAALYAGGLPPEAPTAPKQAAPAPGSGALEKHAAAVAELRKARPHASEAELRALAWRQNPGLAEEYRRETAPPARRGSPVRRTA